MEHLLLKVPPVTPRWLVLKLRHNIHAFYENKTDLMHAQYSKDGIEHEKRGHTEKEAVIALIHTLKLEGWESVSL